MNKYLSYKDVTSLLLSTLLDGLGRYNWCWLWNDKMS